MSRSTPEEVAEQYRDASNLNARVALHERFSTNRYGWHRWVFDRLRLGARSHVLELGCGPGYLWRHNLARVPLDWEITLSDLSTGMLCEAEQNLSGSGRNVEFAVVDAQSIPFPDARFDAVIANHMLYHVPDRPRALAEIRRVMRPGGRFYAATNGAGHLRELGEITGQFVDATIDRGPFSVSFTLENGAEQIAAWFSTVELRRYDDALVVTEVEPLVAYALSGMAGPMLAGAPLDAFRNHLKALLAAEGAIRITKDSGLFEAW